MDADVVVVGAGVVGLATAAELSRAGLSVVVAERHPGPGRETSSRNSQVLHAGLYYPPGSRKARLCVAGNRNLAAFCEAHGVPFRRTGKWLLALEDGEEERLAQIVTAGRENGALLEEVSLSRFREEEPHVRATAAVLSPSTGILDVHGLFRVFRAVAEENGALFAFRHVLKAAAPARGGYELVFVDPSGEEVRLSTPRVVNAAGLDADVVAAMPGLDVDAAGYRQTWTKGSYFRVRSSRRHLARRLLYPVMPHGYGSVLGIHLTVDLDGELKLGPDVEPLEERRADYAVDESRRGAFLAAARRYLPALVADDLSPDQSGIRARLEVIGAPFRDFVVAEESERGLPGWVNLVGIESPGLTCCLELARQVRELLVPASGGRAVAARSAASRS
ncbi:MAG TPA: NAD(P)/FAD-dependent oxidoreductase [Thermoanaerobaculia bacterium]|nr:NAD(P)/FAD-dependent oxidoreductase [Thermoanaerobaculia bacterium]HQP86471.1 NAD(P)/FAD-dependent oxidoreductase [Thermoanaerobaculia bacterium]